MNETGVINCLNVNINEMNVPLIFIHYGNSSYLQYTLKSAVLFNPDKRVILLGDAKNAHYKKSGIEHFMFDEYCSSDEIRLFDKVYRLIAGREFIKKTYGANWTKFNFKKWFVLYNFLSTHNINKFWIFDSDNLILTSLSIHEEKFAKYDCTEQCLGICMNGFVTNLNVLKGYIVKINELFQRKEYLEQQMEDFEKQPGYGFTMMRAYDTYKKEAGIRRIRLNTIIEGEAFDDCICSPEDMEVYDFKLNELTLKKLYLSKDGNIFTFHLPSQKLIKMNTLNMSWVPVYLFGRVLRHAKLKLKIKAQNKYIKDEMKILNLHESLFAKWYRKIIWKSQRVFSKLTI